MVSPVNELNSMQKFSYVMSNEDQNIALKFSFFLELINKGRRDMAIWFWLKRWQQPSPEHTVLM